MQNLHLQKGTVFEIDEVEYLIDDVTLEMGTSNETYVSLLRLYDRVRVYVNKNALISENVVDILDI